MSVEVEKSGGTWRSFLILLCAVFIFTPISIWLSIAIGVPGAVSGFGFAFLMIAIELGNLFGSPLTKQEVATIFVAMNAINWAYGVSLIQRAYFSQSPVLSLFGLRGGIPYWAYPLPEAGFYISRSFLHPYLIPTWFNILGFLVPGVGAFAGFSLGILNKVLYVDEEKLPYPGVQVQANFCITLTEREHTRLSVFSIASIMACIYAMFVYAILTITGIRLIPVLWLDLSREIQMFLPGACFGIATDLSSLVPSFYLPIHVIVSMIIGSISIWVFGNWYVVTNGISEFSRMYVPGMDMFQIWQWSNIYVWMFPLIGLGISVAFMSLRPKILRGAISSLRRAGKAGVTGTERLFSIWLVIIPFAVVAVTGLLTLWYRAPDYPFWPWWPLIYSVLFSFAGALLTGRAAGTGVSATLPTGLDRVVLLAANYQGHNAWFVPITVVGTSFGGPVDQNFKLAKLTGSTYTGFLKLYFLVYAISIVFSVVFTQMFWSLAQIPSFAYPWASRTWPFDVIEKALWITRPVGVFHLDWIIFGFVAGLAIFVPLTLILRNATFAATILVSLFAGMALLPPFAMSYIIGYILRLVIQRLIGKETFDKYRYTMVAGIYAGTGVAVAIGVSGLLVLKSISTLPF